MTLEELAATGLRGNALVEDTLGFPAPQFTAEPTAVQRRVFLEKFFATMDKSVR